jgi:hypothetical protein
MESFKELRSSKVSWRFVSTQTPQHQIMTKIMRPDYADTGIPKLDSKPLLPWIVEVRATKIEKMKAIG